MKSLFRFVLIVLSLFVALPATGGELSGEQIARRIVRGNGFTWEGAESKLKMILIDKSGARRERVLEVLGRRHGGKLQSVVRFLAPTDVAGTAFLMLERKGGGAEQHIYLPGLRRTRRIVGREQEGSFMGSDFTYADLRGGKVEDAAHRRLPDEKIGGTETYVVDSKVKKGVKSRYSRIRTWVRKSDFVPLRTRFYDEKGKLIKTLYARRIKEMHGKPVVVEARMQNENGHATVLIVEKIEQRDNLPDSAFRPTALER